jgi:hypothetical protein
MNAHRLSCLVNQALGGRSDQTLCAAIAQRFGASCIFCRLMARLIEPDHCDLQLAKWRDFAASAAAQLRSP